MKITVAKSAGFCFGVNRAVEMVLNLLKDGKKVWTLDRLSITRSWWRSWNRRGCRLQDIRRMSLPEGRL